MIFHVAPSVASLNDRPQDIYYIRWRKWQAHHQEIGGPVGILERATSVCVFVYDSSLRVCIIPCQKLISGTSSSSSSHTHSGTPCSSVHPSVYRLKTRKGDDDPLISPFPPGRFRWPDDCGANDTLHHDKFAFSSFSAHETDKDGTDVSLSVYLGGWMWGITPSVREGASTAQKGSYL